VLVLAAACTVDNPAYQPGYSGSGSGSGSDGSTSVDWTSAGSTSAVSGTMGASGSAGGDTEAGTTDDEASSTGSGPQVFRDCAELHLMDPAAPDGVYTIDLDGAEMGMEPFDVWCDMTSAGGGWTLVYAYGFTNFSAFNNGSNAVDVVPTWDITPDDSVPTSTTVPLSLAESGAMEFALWGELGTSFLVRTNISNSVACEEAGGSLVQIIDGNIECSMVETLTRTCTDVLPTTIAAWAGGVSLFWNDHYVYWDASQGSHWPTHDPCGVNETNHLQDVEAPRGAILLRP